MGGDVSLLLAPHWLIWQADSYEKPTIFFNKALVRHDYSRNQKYSTSNLAKSSFSSSQHGIVGPTITSLKYIWYPIPWICNNTQNTPAPALVDVNTTTSQHTTLVPTTARFSRVWGCRWYGIN